MKESEQVCQDHECYAQSQSIAPGCLSSFLPPVRMRCGDEGEAKRRGGAKGL